jgi:hypothetical protein
MPFFGVAKSGYARGFGADQVALDEAITPTSALPDITEAVTIVLSTTMVAAVALAARVTIRSRVTRAVFMDVNLLWLARPAVEPFPIGGSTPTRPRFFQGANDVVKAFFPRLRAADLGVSFAE